MSQLDRDKWNQRYSEQRACELVPPTELFTLAEKWLPHTGRAIDVAGGPGRNCWFLAERGLNVTLADISPIALAAAAREANERKLPLTTIEIDLELEPFPAGPWDVILQVCFLNRLVLSQLPHQLAPGGLLVISQPTVKNLERHPKPPRPFLLEEDELLPAVAGLDILHFSQQWQESGRHEAHVVARRSS